MQKHLLSVLIVFALIGLATITPQWFWGFLFLTMILCAIILVKEKMHGVFFSLLVFVLPWSIQFDLGRSSTIFLPSEYIIGTLCIMLIIMHPPSVWKRVLVQYPLPALWISSFTLPLIFSDMPGVSAKFTMINSAYVFLFFYGVIFFLAQRNDFKKWITLYLLGFLPVMVWGFFRYYQFGFNPVTLSGIFHPFYNDHTIFGACAAMLAGFFLGSVRQNKLAWIAFLVATLAVFLSGSRASILSLLIMFPLALFFHFPLIRKATPVLLLLLALVVWFMRDDIQKSFEQTNLSSRDASLSLVERTKSVTNIKNEASNIERLNRWVSALRMFKEKPHVGFGPGTYQFTYIPFQEKSLENRLTVTNPDHPPPGSGGSAHSELLLQLSENGWPTTLLFVLLLMRWAYLAIRRKCSPIMIGAALALATYYFHMQFNNFLNTDAFAFLFWSMGAVVEFSGNKKSIENGNKLL
ncbi:MAG: O-antigen ligase family protein [Cryomorphaceae bacterium]|nr:O-antigen ligase family protein [Cryomorphaceae bacterium]